MVVDAKPERYASKTTASRQTAHETGEDDQMASIRRGPRLVDIAEVTGLHHSVVSRILNEDPRLSIRPETRERVLTAAQELGYRPNSVARSLKSASSGAVGVIIPSLRNPLWAEVLHGVFSEATALGLVPLIAEVPDDGNPAAYERLLDEGRVDGLLVVSTEHARADVGNGLRVPIVHVGRAVAGSPGNVTMNEEAAVERISEHLALLGHRRVIHIDGPESIDTAARRASAMRARWDGDRVSVLHTPFDERGGFAAMSRALRLRRETGATAITVAGYNQLIGALAALRDSGTIVPRDLSLVGFDDDRVLDYLDVKVTTVRMPLNQLGRVAMRQIAAVIGGETVGDVQVDEPITVVARASTGRPAAG